MEELQVQSVAFVKIKKETSDVLVRADVQFNSFLLKGFKIIRDKKDATKIYVTPPSYFSVKGWRPLFKTNEDTWKMIEKTILCEYDLLLMKENADEIKEDN